MTTFLPRFPLLRSLAALPLAGLLAGTASAEQQTPQYRAEPCCQLCPAAADPSRYPNGFLSTFRHLVQGQDDWLFRSELDLMTQFGPDESGYRKLKLLRDSLKRRGVELVMLYLPTRGLVHPDRLMPADRARFDYERARASYIQAIERYRQLGIVVPDFSPLFNESKSEEKPFFFKGDHHWTPYGAERAAELVAKALAEMPAVAAIPSKEFVTKPVGILGKRGTLQRAAQQICGYSSADQYVPRFDTEPVEEAANDNLFGDPSLPEIVLAGTSNSGASLNFNGFLQEKLGREILNVSVIGGGLEGSMVEYLGSEDFQSNPPKVLIWEFGSYHNLSQRSIYRELLPLIDNGCAERKVLLKNEVALKPGMNQVLFNAPNLDLTSRDHVLDLQYSDREIGELRGVIWYMTGKKDTLKIERPSKMDGGGRFVLELRDDADYADQTLLGVDLELPEGVAPGTKITAKLCAKPAPSTTVAKAQP